MSGRTNGVYNFTRKVSFSVTYGNNGITIGPSTQAGMGIVFTPVSVLVGNTVGNATYNIPNAAEYAAMWDRVMIDKVVMEVYGRNQDPTTGIANSSCPVCYYCSDYNDVANTDLTIIQQMGDCKTWYPNPQGALGPLVYTCYPRYQRQVTFTGLANSIEPARGYVISDTAIPHYGIRFAIETNNYNGNGILSFVMTYHFKVKNVK